MIRVCERDIKGISWKKSNKIYIREEFLKLIEVKF